MNKPTIGQRVFLLPIGNNARRCTETKLRHATVTKVGREYFHASEPHFMGSPHMHVKIRISNGVHASYWPEYKCYETEQQLADEKERDRLHSEIRKSFDTYSPVLSLETLRKIKELLP